MKNALLNCILIEKLFLNLRINISICYKYIYKCCFALYYIKKDLLLKQNSLTM